MTTQVELAIDELFPQAGTRVRNVKFHRGWNAAVTAEQLATELLSANDQIRRGTATRIHDIDGNLDD